MTRACCVSRAFGSNLLASLALLAPLFWPQVEAQTETSTRRCATGCCSSSNDWTCKAGSPGRGQARLIKLGAKVLPLLPDSAGITSKERKERLEKVRASLQRADEEVSTSASLVTIHAKAIRLSDALGQIQKQTGNGITDLREQLGVEVTNPAFDLDLEKVPFHKRPTRLPGSPR